jgi:putative ABC transport system ATP-binding protein
VSTLVGEGLTKTYGSGHTAVTAVADFDIALEAGEVVVLLGPSGSGKTTLISLLAGLLRPTAGTVRLNGEVFRADDPRAPTMRLRHVGFAFQTFNLLPTLSVLDNVALPLRLGGERRKPARRTAAQWLDAVGLNNRSANYPRHLSGGEQQRVSLARALVGQPDIVLADEPTASLDTLTAAEITDLLTELTRQNRQACLIVTHDSRLADAADRLIHMNDGRQADRVAPG